MLGASSYKSEASRYESEASRYEIQTVAESA